MIRITTKHGNEYTTTNESMADILETLDNQDSDFMMDIGSGSVRLRAIDEVEEF